MTPPMGAVAANVTVPVVELPPVRVFAFNVRPVMFPEEGPVCVRFRLVDTVFAEVALIVIETEDAVDPVETVNVPDVWPAGISTGVETVAIPLLDAMATVAPPAGAAAARVTVPVVP